MASVSGYNANVESFATQSEAVKNLVKYAENLKTTLGGVRNETDKMLISYAHISSELKETINLWSQGKKSEEEINRLIEIRLQNEYKYQDAQTKTRMQMEAHEKSRQEYLKELENTLTQIAEEQEKLEKGVGDKYSRMRISQLEDEARKKKEIAEREAYDAENLGKLRNISLKEYEKEKDRQLKADIKRAEAFDKQTKAKQLRESGDTKGAKTLEREAAKDLKQADNLEGKKGMFGANGQQITNLGGFVKEMGAELATGITDAVLKLGRQLNNAVENAVNVVTEYQAKTNYRLEGANKTFDDLYKVTQKNLNVSALVKQQSVLERIGKAIDQGIVYNVEQRAFLAEVSEKIQGTFDAFDSNLLRLVRIQAADSTQARLGMEKALNDMLTTYYKDSSYLNDAFDSVSSALLEMTANQDHRTAVETEYVVQKWLGGLYSTGASSNAIQQIAQGIGYLGSGNVNALSSNQGLQSLLAISASRAGLDYGQLLTGGLNATNTNRLLAEMVSYLAEIAQSTSENKVTTSAFGNIFGLSLSDIKAFANLSTTSGNLFSDMLSYESARGVSQSAMNRMATNLGTAQMMQNVVDNAIFNTGMTYANGTGYVLYKVVDLLEQLTGGGPEIKIAPWGIGTSFKVFDIIKTGMFGAGLIGSLMSGGTDIYGGQNLGTWGATEYNKYGTGFNLRTTSGSSLSQTVGNASSQDVENETLKEGMDKSNEIQSATGATEQNIYEALVKEGDKELVSNIKLRIDSMDVNIQKAQTLLDEISNTSSKKSINVNIQKVNGKDITQDSLPTTPDESWKQLLFAAATLIKYGSIVGDFGGGLAQQFNANTEEEYTIQDLLKELLPMISGGDGIPVRLESTDSMQSLMSDLRQR